MSHQTLLEINKGNVGLYLEKDLLHSTIQEMKKLMVEFNNVHMLFLSVLEKLYM